MSRVIDLAALPTDSGIVFPEGTSLNIDSNTLYIDSANNRIGIGTSSPSTPLHVSAPNDSGVRIDAEGNNVALMLTDETTSNGFRFNYNAPNDAITFDTTNGVGTKVAERIRIDSSGNIGIGTSSPAQKLHISSSGLGSAIAITDSGSTGDGFYIQTYGGNANIWNANAKTINFATNDTERMRIDSSGNVGIGTSSPTQKLHITDTLSGNVTTPLILNNYDTQIAGTGVELRLCPSIYTGNIGSTARWSSISAINGGAGNPTYLVFKTNSASADPVEHMRIDAGGGIRIGYAGNPPGINGNTQLALWSDRGTDVLTVDRADNVDANWRDFIRFNRNGTLVGQIQTTNTATRYQTSSDYRLKENVVPLSNGIDRLKQLKPSTWTWIHGGNGEGFIAHEAQTIVPEAVSGAKDEVDDEGNPVYQGIDQSKLVPLLTAALQEAITKIETLETRIQALENN